VDSHWTDFADDEERNMVNVFRIVLHELREITDGGLEGSEVSQVSKVRHLNCKTVKWTVEERVWKTLT
jgi:hypothetical protein